MRTGGFANGSNQPTANASADASPPFNPFEGQGHRLGTEEA